MTGTSRNLGSKGRSYQRGSVNDSTSASQKHQKIIQNTKIIPVRSYLQQNSILFCCIPLLV